MVRFRYYTFLTLSTLVISNMLIPATPLSLDNKQPDSFTSTNPSRFPPPIKTNKEPKQIQVAVLPYHYHDGKAYFLLGKDPNGSWSAFGGPWEKKQSSQLKTALDYFSHQTRYVFGKMMDDIKPLEKAIKKDALIHYRKRSMEYAAPRVTSEIISNKKNIYLYLVCVDFVPENTLKKAFSLPDTKKQEYAWIPADDFMNTIKSIGNKWRAAYLDQQISRQLYTVCHDAYGAIMEAVYPRQCNTPTAAAKDIAIDRSLPLPHDVESEKNEPSEQLTSLKRLVEQYPTLDADAPEKEKVREAEQSEVPERRIIRRSSMRSGGTTFSSKNEY